MTSSTGGRIDQDKENAGKAINSGKDNLGPESGDFPGESLKAMFNI